VDVQITAKPKVKSTNGDAPQANIPAAEVPTVRAVTGVAKAEPGVFTTGARVVGKDGKVLSSFGPPQFGSSWSGETSLVQLRTGRGPTTDNEIAMDAATAKTTKYTVGETVKILTLTPKPQSFTLVGIFGYSGGRDTLGGTQTIAFTTPAAQQLLLGEKDVFTQIQVTAASGVSQTDLKKNIQSALGSNYKVQTRTELADEQSGDIKQALSILNNVLLGFAFVALFVGVFLILNTFSMLVAQRTRELALFRAIGASRKQVIGSVLVEATIIGVIASVVGLAIGIGVGVALAYAVTLLLQSQLTLVVGVPLVAVVAAIAVGLGVTLAAALFPAVRASRIPPVAAMRDAATPDKPLTKITVAGAIVFALGAAALGTGLAGKGAVLPLILGGTAVTFAGVALLTPIISRPIVSLLGRLFSWSVPGMLGRRNSGRNPRRTAITAGALMISIALVTGISTVLGSITASAEKQITGSLKAELIISGQQTGPVPPTFDTAIIDQAKKVPGVESFGAAWFAPAKINGKDGYPSAINDLPTIRSMFGLTSTSGSIATLGKDQVVIDDKTAKNDKVKVGSTLDVQFFKGGVQHFTVSGIYKNGGLNGYIFPQRVTSLFKTQTPSLGLVHLSPGTNVGDVQDRIKTLLADNPEVTVQDGSAYVKAATAPFDFIKAAVQVLLGLALLIAILGIINTLALSVIERTRELGLLRAIGLRRAQMMRMITVESVVISVFGAVLGIVVGIGLGAAVMQALKEQNLTEFALPWGLMAVYLVGSAIVGVLAAILPAIRAARLNVLGAISYE
ncbi:MAG: putative transport system permease protein, partial [Cryptosporangiaceae bacterium]|nr:putative transport system permease protein [Cryptosporangiaceae bacterium]